MWAELSSPPKTQDPLLRTRAEASRTVGWAAAPIAEPRRAFPAIARQPLVDDRPRDPSGLGGSRSRPTFLQHSRDQQTPAKLVEPRTSMGHRESSSVVRPCRSANSGERAVAL